MYWRDTQRDVRHPHLDGQKMKKSHPETASFAL